MMLPLVISLLAIAPQATPSPAPAPSPASTSIAAADKPICHREVPTGSTLPRKVCHTRAEWAAINAANAEDVDHTLQGRRNSMPIEH